MPDETHDTATVTSAHWVSPDGAVIAVVTGTGAGGSVKVPGEIGGSVRVGKASDNDLVLPDATVSRHHLEFVRTDRGLLARDLGSHNGTLIAGTRINEVLVEPGTLIAAGAVGLLVRVDIEGAVVPPSEATRFELAIGRSLGMRRLFGLLERIAPSDASVLLVGESGTGKDVLARSIHRRSPRAAGPFEVVDCGAIARNLVESELFGHERGAFTGAIAAHEGAFERARGGTVFLDEIGELPLELQPKLLRVLESREIRRLGGKTAIETDVRIVGATTRDLVAEVRAGRFRQDLYFRLAVVTAPVPSLRERIEDIEPIAEHMLSSFEGSSRVGPPSSASGAGGPGEAPPLSIDAAALAQLRSHPWPGNVRELRNVLERAAVLARASGASVLRHLDLGSPVVSDGPVFDFEEGISYRDARTRVEHAFERRFVAWILGLHGGNVAAAARAARMDRKYLTELVRKHGLA